MAEGIEVMLEMSKITERVNSPAHYNNERCNDGRKEDETTKNSQRDDTS